MRIKEITNHHRRDFRATYECEHCLVTAHGGGYDDANFHQNVIPKMECGACGKAAKDSYRPLTTKYAEGTVV